MPWQKKGSGYTTKAGGFIKNPIDLAYLAGLVDGEGSINLTMRANKSHSVWVGIRLVIGMTDEPLIQWLKDTYGGSVTRRHSERRKDIFIWTISQQQAADLLKWVRPYLRVRHRQADIAIAVASDLTYHRWNPLTEAVIEKRRLAVVEMHALNKRGVA